MKETNHKQPKQKQKQNFEFDDDMDLYGNDEDAEAAFIIEDALKAKEMEADDDDFIIRKDNKLEHWLIIVDTCGILYVSRN
jgi:hypothetical protein